MNFFSLPLPCPLLHHHSNHSISCSNVLEDVGVLFLVNVVRLAVLDEGLFVRRSRRGNGEGDTLGIELGPGVTDGSLRANKRNKEKEKKRNNQPPSYYSISDDDNRDDHYDLIATIKMNIG